VRVDLGALTARYHRAFNDRDFECWREVFDEDVEILVDGVPFQGVDAAIAHGVGSVAKFPGRYIASERIVSESGDTIVTEIDLVTGDPASGQSRPVGRTCEICRVREGRIVSCRSYYMPQPADRVEAVLVPVRAEAGIVAEEQAALRRVATLVATGAPSAEVFTAVAAEVGGLLEVDHTVLVRSDLPNMITVAGTWTRIGGAPSPVGSRFELGGRNVSTQVLRTGRPARLDAYADVSGAIGNTGARDWGFRSSVGVPISVDGRLWGLIIVAYTRDQPLPTSTEARLAGFTELVATAIANTQARVELRGFADDQAALRRVATLVARAATPEEVFAAVAAEVGRLPGCDVTFLNRYDLDHAATAVGIWSSTGALPFPVGTRVHLGGRNVPTLVFQTERPARIDDYTHATGPVADVADAWGIRSAVGVPIGVDDRLWGVMSVVSTHKEPLPADTELRLADFTELVGTAIANTQARVELGGYADEQAALRRVATLVARAAAPEEVFAAVTAEAGQLLAVDFTFLSRYDTKDAVTVVGGWNSADDAVPVPVGSRLTVGGRNVHTLVYQTHRPARTDRADASGPAADVFRGKGICSCVGAPISVEDRLWGVMGVAYTHEEPLPADIEFRLAAFTNLVATAIANAQARVELRGFADTQAALRRLATLVAQGEPSEAVFAAATREALRYSGNGTARMIRFELDGTATLVANEGATRPDVQVGERWERYPPNGLTATVRRTGRSARVDDYSAIEGGEATLREGIQSAVAVPIHVNGRLWGMIAVGPGPLPLDLEQRLSEFTDLVATAVANAQIRAELLASRARIVAASDEARRRIERDLHDGAQQRLVAVALRLRSAAAGPNGDEIRTAVLEGVDGLMGAIDDLRDISQGIHPAILSRAGLRPALRALARRSTVPVAIDVRIDGRLPEPVEVGTYYVVSEMLTNAAKHARASTVEVDAEASGGTLRLYVRDDGVGGADPLQGSGLVGLKDRIEALGGTLCLHSPAGAGTTITCELPVSLTPADDIQSHPSPK
jgi:GAF domain-containing protein/ketosteroid isomerase-like protein